MTSPTNWPIPTDADTYFRHNEKRVLHEQRRPTAGNGSSVLGPGFAPYASQIDDWNADEVSFNGYFWSAADAANAPPVGDLPDFTLWSGQVIATADWGIQILQEAPLVNQGTASGQGTFAHRKFIRKWSSESGTRIYSGWSAGDRSIVQFVGDTPYLPGPTLFTIPTGAPSRIAGPVVNDGSFGIYCGVEDDLLQIDFTILIDNINNTAGVRYEVRFWPVISNGIYTMGGPAHRITWNHFGTGAVGYRKVETVSTTWWLPPGIGTSMVPSTFTLNIMAEVSSGGVPIDTRGCRGSMRLNG